MAIPYTCPHCGAAADVADEYAGWTGPCVHCGKLIAIPASPGADDANPFGRVGAPPKPKRRIIIGGLGWSVGLVLLIVGCDSVAILMSVLSASVQSAREASRRVTCQNNLKQIALAMHNYNQAYGCFPPA
jgi:hypothetical protein